MCRYCRCCRCYVFRWLLCYDCYDNDDDFDIEAYINWSNEETYKSVNDTN